PQKLAYMNAAEIVSTALVPLVSQDGVVGLMLANMHQEGQRFSEHDTGLLQTLANQASIALDRIRLLEETRLRARREQLLREIAAKVRSSTQVDGVMRTAVQEVGRALGRKTFLYLDQSANQEQNPEKDA
ncbi:MAG: GAF domain-containing protein, partial [Chloroflexi bacterium]